MLGFHVATFNLENLNRPGVFYVDRDDPPYDAASFDTKCEWIGNILDEGSVDLVGLQEVFSFEAVAAAVQKSKHMTSAGAPTVLAPGTQNRANEVTRPNGRIEANGPFVGLATTLPVLEHESIALFPPNVVLRIPFGVHDAPTDIITLPIDRFERAVLKARVTMPGGVPATVLVAHLKSKRPKFLPGEDTKDPFVQALGATRSLLVRAAEAVALRAIVAGIIDDPQDGRKGEPLIVLGDLNDGLTAVTTQVIAGDEPPFYWSRAQKQRLWDVLLYSVYDIQEAQSYRDVSYTHIFNGRFELLDHIFVSQEFVRQFPERIAEVRNTRIFNDHIFDRRLAVAGLQPAAPRTAPLRSDHGIPVTEISMREAPEPPQP
jgi:endonuclease/exonuclease/phosphatase family metal-dependent hydrolase